MRAVLRDVFESLVGSIVTSPRADFAGGRQAALARLESLAPAAYGRTRNFLAGNVSRLSPWIRHGVLSLAEVRDRALAVVPEPSDAEKFVSELGWRDYWRRVHARLGDGIFENLHPPVAASTRPRLDAMPEDVLAASTGMDCIDAFVRQLHETGWLHNHARMWLASWLVHVRGVRWQVAAAWFLEHLLDGDPASNSLSWQWVAGTFSTKPYLFNRENLERYTEGGFCRGCPLLGACDVEGTYEALASRLFQPGDHASNDGGRVTILPAEPWRGVGTEGSGGTGMPLVWLTLDSLSETSPAAAAFPAAPRLFVIDESWLSAERPSPKRLRFILECLDDVAEVEVAVGDPVSTVMDRAAVHGARRVVVAETPCPRVRRQADAIGRRFPVEVVPWPRFVDDSRVNDLGSFSRYWRKVERSALTPTPS